MLATLKNKRMFAVSNAKRHLKYFIVGAFFYAQNSAFAVNIQGYQTPLTDCSTMYCNCLLAKTEGDSLSYIILLNNFIRKMPKDNEVIINANNSSITCTAGSRNEQNALLLSYKLQRELQFFKKTLAVLKNKRMFAVFPDQESNFFVNCGIFLCPKLIGLSNPLNLLLLQNVSSLGREWEAIAFLYLLILISLEI